MSTPLPEFSLARVLVAGDGEALHFGHTLNGMAGSGERPAAGGWAAHGARLVNS